MAAITVLHDVAQELIGGVVQAFADAAVTLPDRQYVHHGDIALDCEQVVVTFTANTPGLPGPEAPLFPTGKCSIPYYPTYEVWIIRCVPGQDNQGHAPTVADLEASALALMTDAKVLYSGLQGLINTKAILVECQKVHYLSLAPYGPLGGFGGNTLTLQVQPE